MTDRPVRVRSDVQGGSASRDRSRPPAPEPLAVPVPDNHCHLDIADGSDDAEWLSPAAALEQAAAVGVDRIVQVGYDLASSRWSVDVARKHGPIVAAVALHPNEAPRLSPHELAEALGEIEVLATDPVVRAIGETGLDYFRTGEDGRRAQHESFRAHIDLAKRHAKALVIHDRDAHDDVLSVLEDEGAPERVVFHCYSGDEAMARHCAERGYYLSFAGTVTYKNAGHLRAALRVTPLDRVLVETDAPYLPPMPYRGRPNASYLVPLTVRAMAEELGIGEVDLCTAIAANTDRAFGGGW